MRIIVPVMPSPTPVGTATEVGLIGADLARRKGAIMTSLGSDEPLL
jgi:hypothetical protein